MEKRIRQTLAEAFDAEVAEQARLDNLGGHASLRIYWRVHLPVDLAPPRVYPRGDETLMAMVLPEGVDPLKSAEGESSKAARPKELSFVNVQRYLANLGMPVPSVDRVDMARGVLLLEDLGDRLFEHAVLEAANEEAVLSVYREAIDLLVEFQCAVEADEKHRHDCVAFTRSFDDELLSWELHHYLEWGVEAQRGKEILAPVKEAFEAHFKTIVDELTAAPQTLSLRDYQSRNIMYKKDCWILIDFQDALKGPVVYDLVALLRDSYIELTPEQVSRLVNYYIARGQTRGLPWCKEGDKIRRLFHLQTLQRKLKDAGRFIFIDRVKKNPDFLSYYEPSIQYVKNALENLDHLDGLQKLLAEVEPSF